MFEWTEVTVVDGLTLRLVTSDSGLRAIDFDLSRPVEGSRYGIHPIATETARQLRAYFAGQLRRFDLPLDMRGTDFQLRVWREVERIPYGETRSYLQMAEVLPVARTGHHQDFHIRPRDGVQRPRHQLHAVHFGARRFRSEEHTSELQSLRHLVCR